MFGKYARFAVCLGVAMTIAACHQSEAPNPGGDGVHENVTVALNTTKTLVVKLTGDDAAAASVKYAGKTGTRSGNDVIFENAASNGTVDVTGTDLIAQSFTIDFGERATIVVEVNAVKASTNIISQADAEGGSDVTNDTGNQDSSGVTSKLNLGTNGSVPTYEGGMGSDYSLVVYTPAVAPINTTTQGQTYERVPYSVDCQPSGVSFEPAAHMELTIPGISEVGEEGVKFVNGTEEAGNTTVSESGDVLAGDVPHYSAWNVLVSAVCTDVTESSEVVATGALTDGENYVTYKERAGFKSDVNGILSVWLKLLYGATYIEVAKSTIINATGAGSYTISQKTITTSFRAGNKSFQVTTYGEPTCTVTYTGAVIPDTKPEPVPTHNGGSND